MIYNEIYIERFENTGLEPAFLHGVMRLNPGARIIESRVLGPLFMNRSSQIGPDAVVGKYFGMNEHCFAARATARGVLCDRRAHRYQPIQPPDRLAQYQRVPIPSAVV